MPCYTVHGKYWSGKQLVNLANRRPFASNYIFLEPVLVIHAAHSPIIYPTIHSDKPIHQCSIPLQDFPMYGT